MAAFSHLFSIADIPPPPPPDLPVCSVIQKQTGGSRLIRDTDLIDTPSKKRTFLSCRFELEPTLESFVRHFWCEHRFQGTKNSFILALRDIEPHEGRCRLAHTEDVARSMNDFISHASERYVR